MGHFTIELPENKKGDVRWGMVKKMQFSLLRKNKSESKRGYIVNLSDSFKDSEGKDELDDNTLILIKNAIIEKEKELNSH